MGEQRISKRTLGSGEQVLHHPPDDAHPDGKQVLIREGSPLKDRLDASLADNQAAHQELMAAHTERIEVKKASQAAQGLPPDKSAI